MHVLIAVRSHERELEEGFVGVFGSGIDGVVSGWFVDEVIAIGRDRRGSEWVGGALG